MMPFGISFDYIWLLPLAVILPARLFREEFEIRGLPATGLSHTIADAGTVTSPLVPWNSCGAYMAAVLGIPTLLYLPFLMSLGVGVGLNNAKAVFEAVWSAIKKKPSEFVRTPKYGVSGRQNKWKQAKVFTPKRLWLPALEIAMGCYMLMCIYISIMWSFGQASIPFLLIFAGGYFYVGFSSLHALHLMNRAAQAANALAEADAEPAST